MIILSRPLPPDHQSSVSPQRGPPLKGLRSQQTGGCSVALPLFAITFIYPNPTQPPTNLQSLAMPKNTLGCFICRIRRKKVGASVYHSSTRSKSEASIAVAQCDRLGPAQPCGSCMRLNIVCVGNAGESVPPQLKVSNKSSRFHCLCYSYTISFMARVELRDRS